LAREAGEDVAVVVAELLREDARLGDATRGLRRREGGRIERKLLFLRLSRL
jgi:hypothetical protein